MKTTEMAFLKVKGPDIYICATYRETRTAAVHNAK